MITAQGPPNHLGATVTVMLSGTSVLVKLHTRGKRPGLGVQGKTPKSSVLQRTSSPHFLEDAARCSLPDPAGCFRLGYPSYGNLGLGFPRTWIKLCSSSSLSASMDSSLGMYSTATLPLSESEDRFRVFLVLKLVNTVQQSHPTKAYSL